MRKSPNCATEVSRGENAHAHSTNAEIPKHKANKPGIFTNPHDPYLFLRLFLYSCFLASLGTTFPSFSDALAFHIRRLVSSLPVITNLSKKARVTFTFSGRHFVVLLHDHRTLVSRHVHVVILRMRETHRHRRNTQHPGANRKGHSSTNDAFDSPNIVRGEVDRPACLHTSTKYHRLATRHRLANRPNSEAYR